MRNLIYSMGVSLDGYIAGPGGEFDWSAPDEELHRFHNEQTRELGAHICGRRLYEVMVFWETADRDPAAEELARLREEPGGDIAVGGAGLAAEFMALDLIDEYRLFVNPVVAGGGTPFFATRDGRLDLELVETQTFGSRVVYVRYRRV